MNFLEIVVVVEFFLAFPPGCREETEEKTADCDDDDDDDDDALVLLGSIVVVESADAAAKNMMMSTSSPLFSNLAVLSLSFIRGEMIKCLLSFSLSLWSSQTIRTQNKQTTVSEKKKKASSFSLSLSGFCACARVSVFFQSARSLLKKKMK